MKQLRSGFSLTAGLLVAAGLTSMTARADVWNKRTILTVNRPIQIEDTYLDRGTYVLRLLDSDSNRHIVQIFNSDQNRLINTVLAVPNYRLRPTGNSRFTFYETPDGTAPAMQAWFYPGDNYGQEFRYPTHLRQVALNNAPVAMPDRASANEQPPASDTSTAALAGTQSASEAAEPQNPVPQPTSTDAGSQQSGTTRDNNATRDTNNDADRRAPVTTDQSTAGTRADQSGAGGSTTSTGSSSGTLPQTGTAFPLVGLSGLLSLAGYGLLRVRATRQ